MRKRLILFIIICITLIIVKFRFANYNIEYKLNNYTIKTVYKNNRFYYEIISKDNKKFNFDMYSKRGFKYTKIDKIIEITDENLYCIYPVIKDIETYPLCYQEEEFIDYNLIDSPLLETYKKTIVDIDKSEKDFVFYNNLGSNEYIALWNYKGYIVMNNKSYQVKDLFSKDKYDNTLAYLLGDTIYMSNNDEEHEFTSLISLNLTTLSTHKIALNHSLDFDSYIVGNIKKNLYIFDNKYSILYEVNTKNGKVNIIGNNEKGFVKYKDGEFVTCSKSEYKVDKIKYNSEKSNYNYIVDKGVYKIINNNKNIKQKISNDELNIIDEKNNILYYLNKDVFYKYDPSHGYDKVFYNYELSFNSNNTIFVYNK